MRADAQANREKILDAARELFAERGVDVDVREICDRAGIGMGTLYRHFATKDDLVDVVVGELAAELELLMDRFDRRENAKPPLVEWLALHDRYGLIGKEVHAHWAGTQGDPPDNGMHRSADGVFAPLRAKRMKQWRDIDAAGGLRRDIPPRFLMEVWDGLLAIYLDVRERWDRESARDWLGSIFAEGVRPRDTPSPPWSEVR